MVRPTSLDRAKKMLADAGYDGTKVVLMQPSDIPITSAFNFKIPLSFARAAGR